jgi:hypothetical protein
MESTGTVFDRAANRAMISPRVNILSSASPCTVTIRRVNQLLCLFFASAGAVALVFLVVIPAGNLLFAYRSTVLPVSIFSWLHLRH